MTLMRMYITAGLILAAAGLSSCTSRSRIASEELYKKAVALYQNKDFSKAETILSRAMELDHKKMETAFLYGKTLFLQKKFSDARKVFNDVKKMEACNYDACLWYVKSCLADNEPEAAKTELLEMQGKHHEDWKIYFYLYIAEMKSENADDALKMLKAAEGLIHEGSAVYFEMACFWENLGIKDKAQKYFDFYRSFNEL